MTFKYVVFQYVWGDVQHHYAVLFPENLVHSLVAEAQRHYKHGTEKNWVRAKPVSAGMCSFVGSRVSCSGDSESLGMKPHDDDPFIIAMGSNVSCMFSR